MLSYKENMQRMWEGFCQTSVLPAVVFFQAQQTTYVAWKSPDLKKKKKVCNTLTAVT